MTTSIASTRTAGTFQPQKPSKFDLVFCGLEDQSICKNKLSMFRAMLQKANIPGLCGIWKRSTFLLCTKKKKVKVEGGKKRISEGKKKPFQVEHQTQKEVSESKVQNF